MKKLLALILALALCLSMASAMAATHYKVEEDFETFDVELDIPDGYEFVQHPEQGWLCVEMTDPTGAKPFFDMHVSPSEAFGDKSLADFTDEEKAAALEAIELDFAEPVSEYFTTPSGNEMILTRETSETGEFATIQTVYHGFFFYLYCAYPDYRPLNDGDLALMNEIVHSVQITGTSK